MVESASLNAGSPRPFAQRFVGWAAAAALLLLLAAVSLQEIWTPDTWWQLRTGQMILDDHAFPTTDAFSYTVADHDWIELRWIFCSLEYLVWKIGGFPLIVVLQLVMVGIAFGVIARAASHATATWVGLLILTLGLLTGMSRFAARPELVTFVMMSAFLVILHTTAADHKTRLGWILPGLQIMWVNSHTLFVLGPILAWTFVLGDVAHRLWSRWRTPHSAGRSPAEARLFNGRLILQALIITAACAVNPWGLRGAMFPLILFSEIQKDNILGHAIDEFQSPLMIGHWTYELFMAIVLSAAVTGTFVLNWRRLNVARLIIFVAHVYLAGVAIRNIGIFAIAATWAAMQNVEDVMAGASTARGHRFVTGTMALLANGVVALGCTFLAWYIATDRFTARMGSQITFGFNVAPWSIPAGAAQFLLDHKLQSNLFHSISDGDYLTWTAHDQYKVHVDGRLEVYGEQFLARYFTVGPAEWDAYAAQHGINTAIVQTSPMSWLVRTLLTKTDWAPVYLDARDIVFARDIPEHAEVIANYRIDPSKPWQPRGSEPKESRPAWAVRLGAVTRPWHSLGMAQAFVVLGSIDNAIVCLQQGLAAASDDAATRLMLAQIYRSRDRDADADELTRNLSVSSATQAWADELLADLFLQAGRARDAVAPLERAAMALETDVFLWNKLGNTCFAVGDWTKARFALEQSLKLQPDVVDAYIRLGMSCEKLGDRPGAVNAYHAALARNGLLVQVHNQLGLVLAQSGDIPGAIASFEAALRVNPEYEPARRNLELARRSSAASPSP